MADASAAIDPATQQALLDRARDAANSAYVPYSRFPVGAALLTADGSIFTGCNVENGSYGLTICAERSAAVAAVGAGHREFLVVAVAAPRTLLTTPCGACRQVLNEFRPETDDMIVVLDDGGSGATVRLEELLPRAFGPRDLERAANSSMDDVAADNAR
jgi:cytidine deaminase